MKPEIYYGNNPQQFAPCDLVRVVKNVSVKLHPTALSIRNKRKRARFVKSAARLGIKFFMRSAWEIHPLNKS
jgi:hypothetical protein